MKISASAFLLWSVLAVTCNAKLRSSKFQDIVHAKDHGVVNENREDRELSTSTSGQITSITIFDAENDLKIYNLKNGSIISVNQLYPFVSGPSFNLRANVNGTGIKSVEFGYNRTRSVNVENVAPYTFCGNNLTDYFICNRLGLGTHTVTATPFSRSGAKGTPGLPYTVTFTIIAEDTTPPELLNFVALTPTTVDVTTGNVSIKGELTFRDDATGFALGEMIMGNRTAQNYFLNQFTYYGFVELSVGGDIGDRVPVGGGIPVTVPFSFLVKKYLAPGTYPLKLQFADISANYVSIDTTELGNRGLLNTFTVINNGLVDTMPPQLLDFKARSPLTINSTAGQDSVSFTIVVQDDLTGFSIGQIYALSRSNPADFYFDYFVFEDSSEGGAVYPAGVPHAINFTIPFTGLSPANYTLRVTLYDDVRNFIRFSSANLTALGYPGVVTVVS